ncbi:DNA primase regulatory subunit PriL [Archaeoglobus neptunius]|uniref:DNA primase regulatory subunit PriL n=1 Tax=Archaeoglobus neptunius TaxID=2798580 RepID=UPI00192531B0|nr:DNA primase regulatory subunit PriL [Archaeoglobus neptunius]
MKYLPLLPILSRYPFLKISSHVFTFDVEGELVNHPDALEAAKKIVGHSIDGKVYRDRFVEEAEFFCAGCDENCYDCTEIGRMEKCDLCMRCFESCTLDYPEETVRRFQARAKMSLLTYIASRMIVSAMDDWVRMRYAVNEASYYSEWLKKDAEKNELVLRLVAIDMGVKLDGWNVHISDYVRASSRIRDDRWRLLNRRLRHGFVETSKFEVVRIIEELLRAKLFEKVPVVPQVRSAVEDLTKKASKEAKKFDFDLGDVDLKCLPPCMKEILSELKRGMNIPHTARFAITSFLLNIGMDVDGVIALFKSAPDFDEEKTRYQVEHIAGERGKGSEYISPSCDTMRTYQNCISNCRVTHPLIYYKKCKSKKGKV